MKSIFLPLFLLLLLSCGDPGPSPDEMDAEAPLISEMNDSADVLGNDFPEDLPEPNALPTQRMSTTTADAPLVESSAPLKQVAVEKQDIKVEPTIEREPAAMKKDALPLEQDAVKTTIRPAASTGSEIVAAVPSAPDHSAWNQQLQRFVNASGNVNYAGWKQNEGELDAYLAVLAASTPQQNWGREASMAYWLNVYNAFTIKLILQNWPVQSITDLHGGKPWDVKWINLAGKKYGLNQIENEIIRPRYKDARIHFAVNCAAASCPPLHNKAFVAEGLNATLNRLTRQFINNSKYNTVETNRLELSKIFDWYGSDFGGLQAYVNRFTDKDIDPAATVDFQEYDWALNKQ